MEHLRSLMVDSAGYEMCGRNLLDEMNELRKLRTAVMIEKCLRRNEVLLCPKPRKQSARSCREIYETGAVADLSNILISKASPPYFSGSPPIRSGNPLVHNAQFHEQRPVDELPVPSAKRNTLRTVSTA